MSALSLNIPHPLSAVHADTSLKFASVEPGLYFAEATIRTRNDLAAVQPFLSRLDCKEGAARTPFQSSEWLRITAETLVDRGVRGTVRVLFGFERDEAVAALPLYVGGVRGCRIARSLGDPLAQYSDLMLAERSAGLRALGAALRETSGIDAFLFRRVREDSHLHALLLAIGAQPIYRSAAPFADLARYGEFDDFLASQPKKTRERRRLRRRGEREGTLTFEIAEEPARAAELTRLAIALKRRWLHEQSIPSITLTDDLWCDILANIVAARGGSFRSVVSAIFCNGEPAAIEIGFVKEAVYCAFLGAFDPRFKDWSPTKLAMEETLRWCFASGIGIYDLMSPKDSYKAEWTNNEVAVADWLLARTKGADVIVKLVENYLRPAVKRIYPVINARVRCLGLSVLGRS